MNKIMKGVVLFTVLVLFGCTQDESLYLNGAEDVFKRYTIGKDGVAFSLPANSRELIQTSDGL